MENILIENLSNIKAVDNSGNNSRQINVMVLGEKNSGKTTLIDLLSEKYSSSTKIQSTETIQKSTHIMSNIAINFFDTPGLKNSDKKIREQLHEIIKHIYNMDIIVLCLKMANYDCEQDTIDVITYLKKMFGYNILEKIIVVSTFAAKSDEKNVESGIKSLSDTIFKKIDLIFDVMPIKYYPSDNSQVDTNNHIINGKINWFANLWIKIFILSDKTNNYVSLSNISDKICDKLLCKKPINPPPQIPSNKKIIGKKPIKSSKEESEYDEDEY